MLELFGSCQLVKTFLTHRMVHSCKKEKLFQVARLLLGLLERYMLSELPSYFTIYYKCHNRYIFIVLDGFRQSLFLSFRLYLMTFIDFKNYFHNGPFAPIFISWLSFAVWFSKLTNWSFVSQWHSVWKLGPFSVHLVC